MATPTANSVSVSNVNPADAGIAAALVYGTKWGGGMGSGVALTYSFPTGTAWFIDPYSYYQGTTNGWGEFNTWYSLSTQERTAVQQGLAAWSKVANITFTELADNSSTVGELRFARTAIAAPTENAHGYYPFNYPSGGDVWFKNGSWHPTSGNTISGGSYDYLTILHEIGHALGLKHTFEGSYTLPALFDNYFWSIMSYTARYGSGDNYASFYPTTPMYFDLVAIQALYGAVHSNTGNDTYTFNEGSYYFQTIYDTGGTDTIVYNGTQGRYITLNEAEFSELSTAITFSNGSTTATVTIGPYTVIENATGGSGADTIVGNHVGNVLTGNGGGDTLRGQGANDTLYGGAGNDFLYGDDGEDELWGGDNDDQLYGWIGADRLRGDAGIDRLWGQDGNDLLEGGAGNDFLYGDVGDDEMRGGSEDDQLYGWVGNDRMFGDDGNDQFWGQDGDDIVYAWTGDDSMDGGPGTDTLNGQGGNDFATGGDGNDFLYGETGNDRLFGWVGNDWIEGGIGDDIVNGQGGSDRLFGGDGTDLVQGEADFDIIYGGRGTDTLQGGAGGDQYWFPATDIESGVTETATFDGTDLFVFAAGTTVSYGTFAGGSYLSVSVGGGVFRVNVAGASVTDLQTHTVFWA